MRKAMTIALTAGAMFGLIGVNSASAAEADASMLANTCNGCHGPDGVSQGPATPTIAGMNKYYLKESMTDYRDDPKLRPATVMDRIAKGYTDAEIDAIADYYSKKTFGRVAEQNTDPALVKKGEEVTRDLCEDCHEKDGYIAEDYPVLAGQMMPYLRNTLHDFISGARSIDDNPDMSSKEKRKKKSHLDELKEKYGDDALEAAVNFFASRK